MKALGKGSIASIVKVALDLARIVLWVAAAVLIAVLGAYALVGGLVAAGVLQPSALADFEGNLRIGDEAAGAQGWPAIVPALAAGAIVVFGALIIVGRLRRLFEGFSSGEPFRREYADHLRVIWITMLVVEVARYAMLAVMGGLIVAFGGNARDATLRIEIDLSTWLSIFVLIVLAEVFREGVRLKEEQELTI